MALQFESCDCTSSMNKDIKDQRTSLTYYYCREQQLHSQFRRIASVATYKNKSLNKCNSTSIIYLLLHSVNLVGNIKNLILDKKRPI